MVKNQRGFSIIEVLLAIAFFIAGVVTITLMYINSLVSSTNSLEETSAIFLAQEGLEAIKSIRNSNFNNLSTGNYELALTNVGWKLLSTNGLVGHWPLNGDAKDKSGYGNDGTIYGATPTEDRKGLPNSALSFDGVDDYINFGNPSSLNITNAVTVAAWVHIKSLTPRPSIAGKGTSYWLFISTTGSIYMYLNTNEGWHNAGYSDSYTWTDGWHHIAGTYDSQTNSVKYYRDGILVNTITSGTTGSIVTTTNNFIIGRENLQYINGLIDDVRIYNRALSAEEIQRLFNLYEGKYKREIVLTSDLYGGLVGYWKFDEGSGLVAFDSSGNGNDGTLKSSASPLAGWSYRRPITISNSTSSLSDYQILVTLDTASLISGGKMRSDCGDIRFTDSNGTTQLNYWLEYGCNTTSTKLWVKVPSIPTGTKTIYLYYGNTNATSTSDGNNTFAFFDDFNDGIIDTNKWEVQQTSGYVQVSEGDGLLKIDLINSCGGYVGGVRSTSAYVFGPGYITVARSQLSHSDIANTQAFSGFGSSEGFSPDNQANFLYVHSYWFYAIYDYHKLNLKKDGTNAFEFTTTNPWDGVFRRYEARWLSTEAKDLWDDTLILSTTSATYIPTASNLRVYLIGWRGYNSGSGGFYTDWIFVRKYTSPEPTLSLGVEEFFSPPTWAEGKVGSALSFDGVDDYVEISDSETLHLNNAMTIMAWIYPKSVAASANYVVSKGNDDQTNGQYGILLSGQRFSFHMFQGGHIAILGSTAMTNNWYHIAGTWDGTNLKLFVNGLLDAAGTWTGVLTPNTLNLQIGRLGKEGSLYQFNGIIDQVRIYNRALSEEEIQKIYLRELYNLGEEIKSFIVKSKITWQDSILNKEREIEMVERISDIY